MALLYGGLYVTVLVVAIGGFYVATKAEDISLLLAGPIAVGCPVAAGWMLRRAKDILDLMTRLLLNTIERCAKSR